MEIEEGKFYRSRGGGFVGPMKLLGTMYGGRVYADEIGIRYQEDGRFINAWSASSYDLIEEWEEPAALPPATESDDGWGDWLEGRLPSSPVTEPLNTPKYDYREECINGVWRWQSRPRKPVVKKLERVIGTPTKSYRVSFNEIDGVIDCSSVKMEPL